ncbi:ACP S-malonyltransferase [Aminivibrio sp.]|jgi:[acyl-carrier-protein] S-malonyltransferase|uniref:ACP S-malonyltransferase n=1 Tax=Aminivibrio sp. TaxID=1872489 RepID=UPI001A46C46E|nr:ACP S-malonyltransferase [Aminivibrio sp.]MBL3538597.1 ACP S-malonyltransferase [Aminivibrio sp.]
MAYSLIFPGQGSQEAGMGKDFFDAFPSARDVFLRADQALGFSLSSIIFNGPEEELMRTAFTQPAILTVSTAILECLKKEAGIIPAPLFMAGHSLGEYTALVASGVLSLEDGVRLVHLRGRLMQEAVPEGEGAMAAILGLDPDLVSAVCSEAAPGGECRPANFNSPGQVVISGSTPFVRAVMEKAKEAGAKKTVLLNVSAPFHSRQMRPVADSLREAFGSLEWHEPSAPIVSNALARPVRSVHEIQQALFDQTFMPVLWNDSVNRMADDGVDTFFEIGPGSVLSGLVKKCRKGVTTQTCGSVPEFEALSNKLKEMV